MAQRASPGISKLLRQILGRADGRPQICNCTSGNDEGATSSPPWAEP
jgi:hypothetical protein